MNTYFLGLFRNEPLTDFSLQANRLQMQSALEKVKSMAGKTFPIVIGKGTFTVESKRIVSYNPANPKSVVATFHKGNATHVNAALDAAWTAFKTWSQQPARYRAQFLLKAAAKMRADKHLYSAAMVIECGKSWVEADADTAESIDFLEFYAREAIRLGVNQPCTQIPGEISELFYIPLGVGAVIPPWNFPNAILLGMTSAAIVAGNTVVLKPSSDSLLTAWLVFNLLREVGIPSGVVNFLPGAGEEVGKALVTHAQTRFVLFTGSKEVGLGIAEKAGKKAEGQLWIKRSILEMGGKDTIVVADDCDLDAAAAAVVASAFSFQGQKCSACSRVIVMEGVHDQFVKLLFEKTKVLTIGDPQNPDNYMGPMINVDAMLKTQGFIDRAEQDGAKLILGGKRVEGNPGFFLEPTIFTGVEPGSELDQEEAFGPLLAVLEPVATYDEALELANATDYGLTGSVWTKDRARIDRAKREFHVGNLYFNRKCTGALVDVHPFGGFNMSGTDSKAGGRDYLLLLMQAKSISEKID